MLGRCVVLLVHSDPIDRSLPGLRGTIRLREKGSLACWWYSPTPPRSEAAHAYGHSVNLDYAEVERELCRIPEVTAARIVVNGDGRPTEVHVLASPDKHAKQVVRDIQSVAMATFGLTLDRRGGSGGATEGHRHQPPRLHL